MLGHAACTRCLYMLGTLASDQRFETLHYAAVSLGALSEAPLLQEAAYVCEGYPGSSAMVAILPLFDVMLTRCSMSLYA